MRNLEVDAISRYSVLCSDGAPAAIHFLVYDGLLELQRSVLTCHEKIATAGGPYVAGAGKVNCDLVRVRAGGHDEIVFELIPSATVIDDIDTRVNVPVLRFSISRNIRAPF